MKEQLTRVMLLSGCCWQNFVAPVHFAHDHFLNSTSTLPSRLRLLSHNILAPSFFNSIPSEHRWYEGIQRKVFSIFSKDCRAAILFDESSRNIDGRSDSETYASCNQCPLQTRVQLLSRQTRLSQVGGTVVSTCHHRNR